MIFFEKRVSAVWKLTTLIKLDNVQSKDPISTVKNANNLINKFYLRLFNNLNSEKYDIKKI